MTDSRIYERFDAATRNITAQALLFEGKPVGRIVIKFGEAATAYVQIWGAGMSIGRATGSGYDKASQAVMLAILAFPDAPDAADELASRAHRAARNMEKAWNGGTRYANALEAAGFTVCNVI